MNWCKKSISAQPSRDWAASKSTTFQLDSSQCPPFVVIRQTPMRSYFRPQRQLGLVLLVLACCCCLGRSTSSTPDSDVDCDALNTYFFSVNKPAVSLAGAGRSGTTRVKVQLHFGQVSSSMPVVTAGKDGLTHNVVHTWRFLEHYALQSRAVNALNDKATGLPRRFPIPANSIKAASALQPNTAAATATSRHLLNARNSPKLPTHTAPPNALLLSTGSPVGAVADIMDVEMLPSTDNNEPTISLTLDVVHKPDTISELKQHPKQTLDSHAHYHFYTPPGVTVDAAKFLALLETSAGSPADLHMFVKGCGGDLTLCRNSTNDGECIPAVEGSPCLNASCSDGLGECDGVGYNFDPPQAGFSTTYCPCPSASATCESGKVCRPAVGHCDIAEECVDGVCPADTFKLNGARCPWYPKHHERYGPYSADLSSVRAMKVSAEEAAARLSSSPAYEYLREWPSCEGTCYKGMCALRWDHSACCGIHRGTHYDVDVEGEQATTQREGHWEGPEWYCWD